MLKHVYHLYDAKGLDALWEWAMEPKTPLGKSKRFRVLAEFAARKREKVKAKERPTWARRYQTYRDQSDKFWQRYKRRQDVAWPKEFHLQECLYHDPPHFHCASYQRDKLTQIAKIGVEKYHCRIGEFPPFDSVECVHTTGSMHYQLPDGTVLSCSSTRLDKGGDGGCAFDANDLDGGADEEYAFFKEVEERYG